MIHEVLNLDRLRSMSPDEAAALLTVRRAEGSAPYDDQALGAWLSLCDANVRAWALAQRAWLAFEDAESDEILTALRRDATGARPVRVVRWRQLASAGAVMAVVLIGAPWARFGEFGVWKERPGTIAAGSPATAPGAVDYATLKGQLRVFSLPDGSRLTLDTDSAVETAFTPARRDLRLLRGRAFFDVKHDARRPFAVHADGREVVALGTRFDVRMDPGAVRVILIEGTVSVKSSSLAAPTTLLHAGEQLVDRPGAPPLVSPARVDEAMNWQRGFVTFDDDTLTAAATELNRYGPDEIVIPDPRIARLRVTGTFQAGDPMRFGRTLAQVYPVRMVRTAAGRFEIVPAD